MATDDGRLVVVFNGEIYNYLELRDQLAARGYRFRTQSDTEVLLHGYREWRTELPSHLRGMFAFALADRARRELFVARDRFGEKPLFYTQHAGGVSFGSEMKVLAALPELRRDVDDESLAAFLCLNYVPGYRHDAARRAADWSGDLAPLGGRRPPAGWFLLVTAGPSRGRSGGVDGGGRRAPRDAARRLGAYRAPQRRAGRHPPVGRHRFVARRAERGAGGPAVGGLLPDLW